MKLVSSDAQTQRSSPGRALAAIVSLLLAFGLASSLYLSFLYLEVHGPDGATVESFCSVSEGVNCVTVAASEYACFLDVPIAFYGTEYFVIALALVGSSSFGLIRLRRWDAPVFVMSALSLPFCATLAWISAFRIHSVCILCAVIYGVNILLFILLGGGNLRDLRGFVASGLRDLFAWSSGPKRLLAALGAALLASQLLWIPRLLADDPSPSSSSARPGASGVVASHTPWSSQPFAGLVLGSDNASMRVEEFTDFECPFCSKAHKVMLQVIARHPGQIRLVHRDFPLDNACNPSVPQPFHQHACRAAWFARCAAGRERYWPFEEVLFDHQKELDETGIRALPSLVGLDPAEMAACAENTATREAVLKDVREGIARGVQGTPTFFVNGEKFVGAQSEAFWEKKIAESLTR